VRIYSHVPERAEAVRRSAAARRVGRSKEGKREAGRTTKPSRSRDSRAAVYWLCVEGVMLGIESGPMSRREV
jgi:hypothetical protein